MAVSVHIMCYGTGCAAYSLPASAQYTAVHHRQPLPRAKSEAEHTAHRTDQKVSQPSYTLTPVGGLIGAIRGITGGGPNRTAGMAAAVDEAGALVCSVADWGRPAWEGGGASSEFRLSACVSDGEQWCRFVKQRWMGAVWVHPDAIRFWCGWVVERRPPCCAFY